MLLGLSRDDIRSLVYQLAQKNGIANRFREENEKAGTDWYYGFMRRHPQLSLRTPEATSAARARGFNRISVNAFYNLLEQLMHRNRYGPGQQVGCLTSAERGVLVTAVICMNAMGNYIPPMLIFPRVRWKAELIDGAPPGTIHACHPSGWMQLSLFTVWFKHFLDYAKPTADKPVLLTLDGHCTHTKNLEVINLAREKYVEILCFPPHCTHRLQPLDVTFMKPLNLYYDDALRIWLRAHPGGLVTIYQISELFGKAYLQAATTKTAVNGFRATGIWPFNSTLFTDVNFAAARPTDMTEPLPGNGHIPDQDPPRLTPGTEADAVLDIGLAALDPTADPDPRDNVLSGSAQTSFCRGEGPSDIIPYPVYLKANNITKKSRCGTTVVLTSSPYKEKLISANTPQNKAKPNAKEPTPSTSMSRTEVLLANMPRNNAKPKAKQPTPSTSVSSSDTGSEVVFTDSDSDISDMALNDPDLTDQDNVKVDDFVLVKFCKKQRQTYYVGKIVDIDDDEVETTFLKRCDMRKGAAITFTWPTVEDKSWHDEMKLRLSCLFPNKLGAQIGLRKN